VWVLADVFEQDVSAVRAGDEAQVTVGALEGRTFAGHVAYVGDVVDATTRAARARIELANPDGALRPGMFAEVGVLSASGAQSFVPTAAVLARRDEYFVFVPGDAATFTARRVRLGAQTGEHVAILDGLRPGEEVVTRGAILLDAEANAEL
jgi:Cu(I)/Ag(I) efflux system membrane fusion protein